jgi:hypothetical protein
MAGYWMGEALLGKVLLSHWLSVRADPSILRMLK